MNTLLLIALSTISMNWDVPTTRQDGTELLFENIQGYKIYHNDNVTEIDADKTSETFEVLSGNHCFTISTVAEVEGDKSNEICIEVVDSPSAPADVLVSVSVKVQMK